MVGRCRHGSVHSFWPECPQFHLQSPPPVSQSTLKPSQSYQHPTLQVYAECTFQGFVGTCEPPRNSQTTFHTPNTIPQGQHPHQRPNSKSQASWKYRLRVSLRAPLAPTRGGRKLVV